jgi:predicted amidohydrolase
VKLLLAALRCEKGDVDANGAAHARVVRSAVEGGASVVVFPEMSLTGSVDPVAFPERLVALDGSVVRALLDVTRSVPVTVVFGVAERGDGDRAYITQCVARRGELLAVYRKRRLGDDEDGFTAGTDACTFDVDGVRFGVIVCADSTVDEPVDAVVAAGARVVCFCAAPGLYGRRLDDAAFADGMRWWESAGLADARRHARRGGVWVALATQAGATVDEDFPGVAALVSPAGDVVARTPDWREATLFVDVPV